MRKNPYAARWAFARTTQGWSVCIRSLATITRKPIKFAASTNVLKPKLAVPTTFQRKGFGPRAETLKW